MGFRDSGFSLVISDLGMGVSLCSGVQEFRVNWLQGLG